MRREFKDKWNNRSIGIYVNIEASGLDPDETDASEYDSIDYNIHDDCVWSWDDEKILSLDDIDDEGWDSLIEEEDFTYFQCFIENLLVEVFENEDLPGYSELRNFFDEELKLLVLLKDEDDNVDEELGDVDLSNFVWQRIPPWLTSSFRRYLFLRGICGVFFRFETISSHTIIVCMHGFLGWRWRIPRWILFDASHKTENQKRISIEKVA